MPIFFICYLCLVRTDNDLDYFNFRHITFAICHVTYNTEDLKKIRSGS